MPQHVAESLPGHPHGHSVSRSSSTGSTSRFGHGSSSLIAGPAAHPRGLYRRQLVARCRVLRSDIRSFEEEFEAKHKRKPHSSGDRHLHSMQGVYAEYRQLKTLVRDNAALHIQILFRGFAARKRLAAAGLMPARRRAGVRAPAATVATQPRAPAQLAPTSSLASSPATSLRSASALTSASGSAFALRPSGSAPEPSGSASAGSAGSGSGSGSRGSGSEDAALAKLNQLKAEKSTLKAKLRAYDTAFQQQHGRAPSKAEKEALRPQYLRYHELKALITTLENAVAAAAAGRSGGGSSGVAAGASASVMSPHGAAGSGSGSAGRHAPSGSAVSLGGASVGSSALSVASSVSSGRSSATAPAVGGASSVGLSVQRAASGGAGSADATDSDGLESAVGSTTSSATASSGPTPTTWTAANSGTIRELKAEKKRLQTFLRNFERAFEAREGRKVRYVRDIADVVAEYTRYKDVKAALRELTGSTDGPADKDPKLM